MPGQPTTDETQLSSYTQAILEAALLAKIGVCVTVVVDGVPRNVLVSEAAVEILGHPHELLLSRSAFDFIAPEEHAHLQDLNSRRRAGEAIPSVIETVIVQANGRRVPIAVAIVNVKIGDQSGRVSFLTDISARRSAEDALRAQEARFRRLFESAPDGIVVSRGGVVLDANPAAARMLGFDAAEGLLGASLHALMSPDDASAMVERVAAARDGARITPRTYRARRRDGSEVTAEVTSVPYEYEGQPAVMGFARDVTERARLEVHLAQRERLTALGTLAAGVAHEINNPLAVLSLGVDALDVRVKHLCDRADAPSGDIGHVLSDLRGSVGRIASIVQDLRAFSRTDNEAPGAIDLLATLAAAERMAAHQLRHRTRVCGEYGTVPLTIGHAGRLQQVFVNLLLNAVQAMPEGRAENRIDIRAYVAADGRVAVDVKDNGPGIVPDVLRRVFEPFFTTKPIGEGSGLGLAISHGIVKQLGGEIVFESEVGVGTTARVLLKPAPSSETTTAQPRAAAKIAMPSRARVLIVDDEPALISSFRLLLADQHDVTTADDGDAACRVLMHGPSFDVVLCDMMMPVVSGIEVHARIAADRPELLPRIIFMTGGAATPRAAEFLASVPNRVLQKPFRIEDVEHAIAEVRRGSAVLAV